MGLAATLSLGLAALTLAVVPPAPSYDPWAWLAWGRELAGGTLSTLEGPAFKPLPVAVSAALAPLGDAAPVLWVLVGRAGAVLAAVLAYRLGRRLGGGSVVAGVLAAASVALCGSYVGYAASGLSEGLLLGLALAAVEAGQAGRPRLALACAVGCGLLRVETWPFLAVAGVRAWRRRPADRPLLALAAVAVPAAWLVPELAGSGHLMRSAARARIPNAGQPALAEVPLLASLGAAVRLVLWPLWAGVAVLAVRARGTCDPIAGRALAPAAAGLAWIGLVAAMAQAGFSGEPRYALAGAALVGVSGGVGLAALLTHRGRATVAAVGAVVLLAATGPVGAVPRVRAAQDHQWALQADLAGAVAAAGGRAGVLACGTPYVGPFRGTLLAYRLRVPKHLVEPDRPPSAPGVVFRSALVPGAGAAPAVPDGFELVARAGTWDVLRRC